MLNGISASPGIAIGKALVLEHKSLPIEHFHIHSVEEELHRFQNALSAAKNDLTKIRDTAKTKMGSDSAQIFESHLLMLEDPELTGETEKLIRSEKVNSEYAWNTICQNFITLFEGMNNEYMRARAADVRDVSTRVLHHLQGLMTYDLSDLAEDVILVAQDLTPSETATLDRKRVLGFITDEGGKTSHSAIMARTMGIPAVVGTQKATSLIQNGSLIALNGKTGEVLVQTHAQSLAEFQKLKEDEEKLKQELLSYIGKPTETKDGRRIHLEANIGTLGDLPVVLRNDSEGIGLFRTEFIYMDRQSLPSEEEQFSIYKELLQTMNSKPTIIRTLDIGGDKALPYLKLKAEQNPFLGCRAIRLCFEKPEVFQTQLRALLRASPHGNLGIMFPMISSLAELLKAKDILNQTRVQLESEGHPVSQDIQIGIMIEIPSAAISSDILARHCDFFSIGTNDLIQYTCAVDRMNEKISNLYDPYNPAVLRLIQMTIQNAHSAGIPVGMCGEMAGMREFIPLLVGMGIDHLSMNPNSLLANRKLIRQLTDPELSLLVQDVMALHRSEEIEMKLHCAIKTGEMRS